MLKVTIKIKDKDLKQVIKQLPTVQKKIRGDVQRLGRAGVSFLSKLIPKSKLDKPHLRDSFE